MDTCSVNIIVCTYILYIYITSVLTSFCLLYEHIYTLNKEALSLKKKKKSSVHISLSSLYIITIFFFSIMSLASECYQELIKMKEDRVRALNCYQKRVQHHERSLLHIKNRLAKSLQRQQQVESKFNKLVDNQVWVTAEQHGKIHDVYDKVMKECSDLLLQKKKRYELIDKETKEAKLVAGHLVGIERGLAGLESQMKKLFLPSTVEPSKKNSLFKKWLKPKASSRIA